MSAWNYATIWEIVADELPDAPARRSRAIASSPGASSTGGPTAWPARCSTRGAVHQDKVAQYLYNCPEYLESMFAASRPGLVPVNTNYRYADDELLYLWDNADAVCVVFHGTFVERIEGIRDRLPKVQTWLWVDDGSGPCPEWAIALRGRRRDRDRAGRRAVGPGRRRPPAHVHRRHHRHAQGRDVAAGLAGARPVVSPLNPLFAGDRPTTTPCAICCAPRRPAASLLPACPLMHGTGQFTTFITLSGGGVVVLLESRHFDVDEMLDTVEAATGQLARSSWATPSPSRWCGPSTPTPAGGTSRAS